MKKFIYVSLCLIPFIFPPADWRKSHFVTRDAKGYIISAHSGTKNVTVHLRMIEGKLKRNIHKVLGMGEDAKINLYTWDGKYKYAEVQWDGKIYYIDIENEFVKLNRVGESE